MRKNLLSLGVVSAIMLGLSSELIRAQAWSDQSAVSKTGYRLTAENISSSSADIIGDMSQALPEYDITQITLPDGSTAEPDQVNYQVTQSGDYSFEITYQTVNSEEDKSVEMTKFQEHVADVLSEDASKGIEVMSESEEEVSTETQAISESGEEAATQDETQVISESGEEETTQIQTMSDIVKDMTENPQTETVTLTVNLPVMQTSDEADSLSTSTQFNNQLTEISPNNSSVLSAPTTSQISDRSAGISTYAAGDTTWDPNFDYYGSKLEWGKERFTKNTTYYVSSGGMSFNGSTALPSGDTTNLRNVDSNINFAVTDKNPLTFIYGYQQRYVRDQRAWIQYSHGFSDINLDLSKDFALTGTINVGSDFGKRNTSLSTGTKTRQFGTSSTPAGVNIDGGVTISLIPSSDINSVMNAATNGLSGGPRLGAYGAFKNSIVMEYDSGFTIGYDSITNESKDSFSVFGSTGKPSSELANVGDVNIGGSLKIGGINLPKKEFAYYADGTNGYSETYKPGSTPHMGISLTGSNGFAKTNSDRRLLTGNDWNDETLETGVFTFTIEYHKDTKTIDFKLIRGGTSTNSSLTLPSTYVGKTYRLATSFGAVYQNATLYDNGTFFKNRFNANSGGINDIGTGQIAIQIQGIYTQPSLSNITENIMFTNQYSTSISNSITAYQSGYVQGTDNVDVAANKRSYFPVEGDRVVIQNEVDITSLFNEQGYTNTGSTIKLTDLEFTGLSFVESGGNVISKPNALDENMKIEYYYCTNGGGKWTKINGTSVSNLTDATITGSSRPLRWRAVVTLPETKDVTNATDKQFWLTGGKVIVHVARDSTTASFNLPLIKQNSQRLTFFSDPKVSENTNVISASKARLINQTGTLNGKLTGSDSNSISYGISVFYNSTQQTQAYNPNWTDQNTTYTYKSINDILTINKGANNNNTADSNISLTQDTRYIVNYTIYDSKFNEPANIKNYSGNADRAKTSIKRVIWNSSKVTVENGYEFYMEPEVTLSVKDFENFDKDTDKAVYYRKIAKAANVAVFKTSDANWTNLARDSSMEVSTAISGNGQQASHDLINKLIASPGTSQEITIRFTSGTTTVDKTVRVTLTADTPKVVSNGSGNSITNQTATKIIFDKENYTVSATFKLANADNTSIDLSQLKWDDVKDKIKVALYKKNGPQSQASNDKYYRWANKSEATNNGKTGTNTKLDLPVVLKYNNNGTFTVTYTLLNNNTSTPDANWVQKRWEDGAEWKILAWTDSNNPSKDYSKLDDSSTDNIGINTILADVPTVTTTIELIEKSNGSLPATMFRISNVQLNDDGNELSDKRNTTTVSLESTGEVSEQAFKSAQHDYYYEVRVNESNNDSQSRPYTTLTQSDTKKSFNVTYLKYTSDQNTYSDVKKDNTLLGSIAYLSNSKSLPQSIRFGMRADRQTGITSNQKFVGQANFKFVRKSLSGGANP